MWFTEVKAKAKRKNQMLFSKDSVLLDELQRYRWTPCEILWAAITLLGRAWEILQPKLGKFLEKIKNRPFRSVKSIRYIGSNESNDTRWCIDDHLRWWRIVSGHFPQKKWPLIFWFTQDQGSSIVDGINHLRNLLLSIDLFLGEFA